MSYRQQGYKPQARPSKPPRGAPGGARAANGKRTSPKAVKRRKTPRYRPLRVFLLLVVFAFLATLGVMGAMMYKEVSDVELQNTFYPGIYIDDIELYGYTPQQAYDMLLGKARAELSTWSLTVAYREQTWMLDTDKLGMNQSLETIVSDAVNTAFFKGRGDGDLMSIYNRYKTIAGLRAEPDRSYVSGVEKNTAVIDGMLNEIGQAVYQAPQDATRVFDTNRKNAIFVTEEVYGQEADIAKLKAQIMQKVNAMESGVIQVPLLPVTPSVTAEMLRGEYVKLSSFSTLINPNSTKARNENIAVGCDRFNGKTFQPGEKISFNQVVGRRTLENGFFEAEEQVYGVYEKGVGGGICQVSTTLYNAVIQAGLEVISRTNHSVPVGYVELGADATVYDDRIDFVFRNNTGMPIFITAIQTTRDAKKICQFEIYGRPDPNGFSYKLQHDKEEIPIPAKVERVRDKNGQYVTYTDQEKEVKGSVGHKVKTYLLTIDKGGNVLKRSDKPISESYYPPIPTRIYTGAQTRR